MTAKLTRLNAYFKTGPRKSAKSIEIAPPSVGNVILVFSGSNPP